LIFNDEIDELQSTSRRNQDHSSSYRNQNQNRSLLELTHIKIQYLPPNTTAHIQPMDAGIIKSFKAKYKYQYCHYLLRQFENNIDIKK